MNGGAFELRSPQDLLGKIQHDLEELKADRTNTYKAFNFFVTAEHMKDWVHPNITRPADVTGSWLVKTCSHLANGFKHFTVDKARHKSVAGTQQTGGYFARGYLGRLFARGHFAEGDLIIELEADAAKELGGKTITAVALAERVLAFWKGQAGVGGHLTLT